MIKTYQVQENADEMRYVVSMDRLELLDAMDDDVYETIIDNETGEIMYDRDLGIYDGEMY